MSKEAKKARKGSSAAVVEESTEVAEVTEVETAEVVEVVEPTVEAPAKPKGKRGRKGVIPFAPGSKLTTCNYEGYRGFARVEAHPTDDGRQILVYNGTEFDSLTHSSNAFAHDVQAAKGHSDAFPGTSGTRIWKLAEDSPEIEWRDDVAIAPDPNGKPKRGRKPGKKAEAEDKVEESAE